MTTSKRPYGMPWPENPAFDFPAFAERIKEKNHVGMIMDAEAAAGGAERVSYGIKGAVRNREQGSMEFVKRLKALLWFLRTGKLPLGGSDFTTYKMIAEKLVANGHWKKEALDVFTEGGYFD